MPSTKKASDYNQGGGVGALSAAAATTQTWQGFHIPA
jgi:hypothetical protein